MGKTYPVNALPAETEVRSHWARSVPETAKALDTDPTSGLAAAEARARLERGGPNTLPMPPARGVFSRFLLQIHNPLIYVLLVAAGASALIDAPVDAAVILAVVVANATVGFWHEAKAEQALAQLAAMTETRATVVRDGERVSIHSADVVPGDLVIVEAGDKVPADLRLVRTNELRVDESALTGESVPVDKSTAVLPADRALGDRRNMAHCATLVTYGSAAGIVVETGERTQIGLIHRLVEHTTAVRTPLTRKIARFSRVVTVAILILGAVTFAVGVARAQPVGQMFMAAIALAVGAIPEGLPAMVTIMLAYGVAGMVDRGVIVRRLPVVETLGGTTVICTDKTGTLTENRMRVVTVVAGGETCEAVTGLTGNAALTECLTAGLACNDARLMPDGTVVGDPTEGALLTAAALAGRTVAPLRLDTVPFSSERGYMATLHPGVVYVKGAIERVLDMCVAQLDRSGRAEPLDSGRALDAAERLGRAGLRVLAFARAEVPPGMTTLPESALPPLVLLGLQGMLDPPRAASAAAVRACQAAGIKVKMITGDHPTTARAIAAKVGLDGPVVTGTDLANCPDDRLPAMAENASVFARVSPEQKLGLVNALQSRGHVVAMTGDGVNDAPALKRADIGVAMGRSGTEVAKESADMVLTDDDFASIEAAVEQGRAVFDNLRRFIVWALPANVGVSLVLVVAIITGAVLPILPIQVLWLNMTAVLVLGMPFAVESAPPGLMARPPRDPARPLLTGGLVIRVLLVSAVLLIGAFGLYQWEGIHGASPAQARTVVVNVFAMTLMTYLFNCLSLDRPVLWSGMRRNPWIAAAVMALIGLQLLYTYVPVMNALFDSAPLGGAAWLRVAAVAVVSYCLVEIAKAIYRQWLRPARHRRPRPPTA